MGSRFEPIVGITNRGFEVLCSPCEKRKDRRAVVVNWLKVTPSSADLFLAFSKIGSSKTSVVLIHAYIWMQGHSVKHPSPQPNTLLSASLPLPITYPLFHIQPFTATRLDPLEADFSTAHESNCRSLILFRGSTVIRSVRGY